MHTILFPLSYTLTGLLIGSFLSMLVYRLHAGMPIGRDRSRCPHCKAPLAWHSLIPLVSYIALRGRCRHCRAPISLVYPVIELVTALCFFCTSLIFSPAEYGIVFAPLIAALCTVLIFSFFSDLLYMEIYDGATLVPAVVFGAAFVILEYLSPTSIVLGALIGGGWFLLQYGISRGVWVGAGDIRLGVLLGAIVGWQGIIVVLLSAYIGGALINIPLLLLKKKHMKDETSFGTYLVAAGIVVLFVQPSGIERLFLLIW